MNDDTGLELLFRYASEHRFGDFDRLFSELTPTLSGEEFGEAHLMRAQIKLYTTDLTILGDLEKAASIAAPRYPRLGGRWTVDAPNRFIVFPKAAGGLCAFLQALPHVRKELDRLYGEPGRVAVRQIQGEIRYFLGEIDEALALAEEQRGAELRSPADVALSLCLLFRCYLAAGFSQEAGTCMLELIRLAQASPKCLAVYEALRAWANLTTGWSGETPRFYTTRDGKHLPVLDDRLKNIRMGAARATPLEEPFAAYAGRSYEGAYELRQYYMDLFHAMYWFQVEDHAQAAAYFFGLYDAAAASGLLMPFVECGRQIAPLLQYMKSVAAPPVQDWIAMILSRAEQYEKNLGSYRD